MTAEAIYKLTAAEWEHFIEQLTITVRDQGLEIANLLHVRDSLIVSAALGDSDAAGRLQKTNNDIATKRQAVRMARTAISEAKSHLEKT